MGVLVNSTRVANDKRKKLQDIIPISTPMLLLIEPTNCCNQKCKFCPTSDSKLLAKVGRRLTSFPKDFIDQLALQLKDFPEKIKKIHLYKDGESLLYQELGKMISTLKKADIAEQICLKTNGVLMSPEINSMLIDSGLDWLGISVAAMSEKKYYDLTGISIDFKKYVSQIKDFFDRKKACQLYIKLANISLSQEEISNFQETFMPISDICAIENLHGWTSAEGRRFQLEPSGDSYQGIEKQSRIVCPYPFYALAINANCDVSICCNDWAHRTVIGNIKKEKLIDIWNGERLKKFRLNHLMGKRQTNPACADCSCMELLPDNIDAFREIIIERLTKNV